MKVKDNRFCTSFSNYTRRVCGPVKIGNQSIGNSYPVLIQSMGTVDTNCVEAAAAQAMRIFDAAGAAVRFTTQGVREAESIGEIRKILRQKGYCGPLIADIHFNREAAMTAAVNCEKVRINPGNFVRRMAAGGNYSETEFVAERALLETAFTELLALCKAHHTAVRIGVNHGSLSPRILSRYGDTPRGMVESAMELLRVCRREGFENVVVSLKSSNTVVMVRSYRLLCRQMIEEGMNFPLHLGVTEAGEGSDGRIRSAVGIGALLNDGIGDTIRVSLTEAPENEVPVAHALADYCCTRTVSEFPEGVDFDRYDPYEGRRGATPFVIVDAENETETLSELLLRFPEDYIYTTQTDEHTTHPRLLREGDPRLVVVTPKEAPGVSPAPEQIIVLEADSPQAHRAMALLMLQKGFPNPVVFRKRYNDSSLETVQLKAAADLGGLLIDGFAEGIWISSDKGFPTAETALDILQAARRRSSKAEYISCPGCGRTLYDLQQVVAAVKGRTRGLKNIKIAVMGCIVNGPGEMADADYGYVGAGRGLVTLYYRGEIVKKEIPDTEALDELVALIKQNGDWK